MAHLLKGLLCLAVLSIITTASMAFGWIDSNTPHGLWAVGTYLYLIFTQAFIMFYFIGCARMVDNVDQALQSGDSNKELFENPPTDLAPYIKKVNTFQYQSQLCKRQTIPWTMLIILLGMLSIFMGGAVDTGMANTYFHTGMVYGFFTALAIGFFKQWYYLGKTHKLLRHIKALFEIPDHQM